MDNSAYVKTLIIEDKKPPRNTKTIHCEKERKMRVETKTW